MLYRRKQLIAVLVGSAVLGIGLSSVGIYGSQITWKFDAAIIGAFLLGDYPIRWILGLRNRRRVQAVIRSTEPILSSRWLRLLAWTEVAIASGWFLILVLAVGEVAFLVAFITGAIYSGTLPWYQIVELSLFLTLFLGADFVAHYRKDMG